MPDAGMPPIRPLDAAPVDPVPEGRVAAVVGIGHGGRTAISCNGGRTFRVNDFYREPAGDHSPYAVTGLAGGAQGFVASLGWGAGGRIIQSHDGVAWQELSGSSYTWQNGGTGSQSQSTSGAFWDGDRYKVFWTMDLIESADGKAWQETPYRPSNVSHIRETEFFAAANFLLMRIERDSGGRNYLMMTSLDRGKTYQEHAPRTTGCPGFSWGPVTFSHGIILAGGSAGSLCRSEDMGASWKPVTGQANIAGMFADEAALFLLRGGQVLRSEDGVTFRTVFTGGGSLTRGVWSAHTGYVVAGSLNGRLAFFRSDDGIDWKPSAAVSGPSFQVLRMRVGLVTPSAQCPTD